MQRHLTKSEKRTLIYVDPVYTMQLTRAADYAVRVMLHMLTLPPGTRLNRDTLAEAGQVPAHFLGKILQSLTRTGFVVAHRGVTGGYEVSRAAGEKTLLELVQAIEGPVWLNQCLDPAQRCERQGWCPAHTLWSEAQTAMVKVLRSKTLNELAHSPSRDNGTGDRCALVGVEPWN